MFELYKSIPDEEFSVLTRIETRYNYLLEYAPKFEWWNSYPQFKDRNDMRRPDNLCGYFQRMYESQLSVRKWIESGGTPGISLCTGQAPALFCVTQDKYFGEMHPEYGGSYHPMVHCDAYKLPFLGSNTWPFIACNHGLEHIKDTIGALREWIRICQVDGWLMIIMPDANFCGRGGGGDESHESVYSANEFKNDILSQVQDQVFVEDYNTLNNNFSFNVLLRKKRF